MVRPTDRAAASRPPLAVNRWLRQTLGHRARHLGNRQRTVKLLDLPTLGYNHHADERGLAVAIRKWRKGHRTRAASNAGHLVNFLQTTFARVA